MEEEKRGRGRPPKPKTAESDMENVNTDANESPKKRGRPVGTGTPFKKAVSPELAHRRQHNANHSLRNSLHSSSRNVLYMPPKSSNSIYYNTQNEGRANAINTSINPNLREQTENDIFALDIGTHTVIGIVGTMTDGVFDVKESVMLPHKQRAMIDGQIEDIAEVARVAELVKAELEERTGIILDKVGIAAAGRALKTRRITKEFIIDSQTSISDEQVHSFEVETVLAAQTELDTELKQLADKNGEENTTIFYCVGHTVVSYFLDAYRIKNLAGHKGKKAAVELIAAFLPSAVVESLYSVMELCGLEVVSMTLEPIAAMKVIIPPEVRLINIALADIGAGTSDIAVSKNGSIVSYAMSTIAGDEITEEIIKTRLVDFNTAEKMKKQHTENEITYTDILGMKNTVKSDEFFGSLFPVIKSLADNIAESILKANEGVAPAVVFLVGGGSLIPGIAKLLADKLGLPEQRVAVGGRGSFEHINFNETGTDGPEYVTPIGIGLTTAVNINYDYSIVTLNGKKIRILNNKTMTLIDLLVTAGYKSNQVIAKMGQNLAYMLNGEKIIVKGGMATPSEITLNGQTVPINTAVKQGDVVHFIPAINGADASVTLADIAGEAADVSVLVNAQIKPLDYIVQNFDDIIMTEAEIEMPKTSTVATNKGESKNEHFYITLNAKRVKLNGKKPSDHCEFLELLELSDIDLTNPPKGGTMILTLNGKEAEFTTVVKPNDTAVIKWDTDS